MAEQAESNEFPAETQDGRVGRVIVDYDEPRQTYAPEMPAPRSSLGIILIAGFVALLLMVGAMLLILPGVFEV